MVVQAEDNTDKVTKKLTAETVLSLIAKIGGVALGPLGVLFESAAGTVTFDTIGIIAHEGSEAIKDKVKGTTDPIAVSVPAGGVVEYHSGNDVRFGKCS